MLIEPRTDPIDRITPTLRPRGRAVMYQEWHHLLFLHWEVDAHLLKPLIPPDLDIDTYDGRAYLGLIPFTMRRVRPRFLPSLPWLSNFHETNVRTYVHRQGRDPGVWFFSLDAANPIAVAIARATFGLPYFHARMSVDVAPLGDPFPTLNYASERCGRTREPARSRIEARVVGGVSPASAGSLDHFLVERFFLYSRRRDRLFRGQVNHVPYPLQLARVDATDETLIAAASLTRPDHPPLAHYAAGVRVKVFGLTLI